MATIVDEQTGQEFQVEPERWFDVLSAWFSAAYSLAVIVFLGWMVLRTWSGDYGGWPVVDLAAKLSNVESANMFRLIVYTAIGGAIGAAVNNLRSFVSWHAERKAFGWRFVWKYIALPPLGATLAVLVYGILQGGMAVFNGGNVAATVTTVSSLSAWATGTLAGYGSHKVFIWLDDKVNSLFKVDVRMVTVPDLTGKSAEEANQALANTKLKVGETTQQTAPNPTLVGKVMGQSPSAGTEIACDSKVDIIIGTPAEAPAPGVEEAGKNGQPITEEPALPANVEAAVEGAVAGVINPPDVNNPPNGGAQG
jgi:hypothetical protein